MPVDRETRNQRARLASLARRLAAGSPLGVEGLARIARRLIRGLKNSEVPAVVASPHAMESDLLVWGRAHLPAHFGLSDETSESSDSTEVPPPAPMHAWLSARLAALGPGERLNVIGPRGHAKSTLVTLAHVLRVTLQEREPYVWIVTETRRQARAHLDNLAHELRSNARLRAAYPRLLGESTSRIERRGETLVLADAICVEAFGCGQRLRGRRFREHRPSLIVCDDLQSDLSIWSLKQREHLREWFHGTLLKAGDPQTKAVHVGSALHRDALAMQLTTTPGWTSRTFRAIETWPRDMPLWEDWERVYGNVQDEQRAESARAFYEAQREAMDDGAEVQWPSVYSLYRLMCMRAEEGRTAFEREMQGSPVNPDLCEWPESYFDEPLWFETWPEQLTVKTLALDPSKGTSDRLGDYAAYVSLGVDAQGTLLVEAELGRWAIDDLVARGVALHARFQPALFGVESNQFQQLLAGMFSEAFRQRGLPVAPTPLENHMPKLARIRSLGALLAARRVRFKSDSPGTRLLVAQLREFPLADHDDGPDALEMAVRLAARALRGAQRPRDTVLPWSEFQRGG